MVAIEDKEHITIKTNLPYEYVAKVIKIAEVEFQKAFDNALLYGFQKEETKCQETK